jgi:two-component system sensor histidine kinase EvgS
VPTNLHFTILQTVILVLVAVVLPLGPWPDAAADQSDGPPAEVRFRGNDDFSPYEFINDENEADGYNVELVRGIARQMGLTVNIDLGQWAEVRQELEQGKIDALTGELYSIERDAAVDFAIPHIVMSYAVFVREDTVFENPNDLKGQEVIVVKDVYAHDWLVDNDFSPYLVAVSRPEEALLLLSQGRHDCAVLPRLHGLDRARSLNIDNLKTIGPPLLTQKMSIAVKAGDADLLAKINEGLYRLQSSGEYDRIYRKWFSVYEQKRLRDRLLRIGKLVLLPLILLAGLAGFWIRSLRHVVTRRTQALKENQLLLNRIVQGIPLPTAVFGRDGQLLLWNRACEELTNISADVAAERSQSPPRTGENDDPLVLDLIAEESSAGSKAGRAAVRPKISKTSEGATDMEVCLPQRGDNACWLHGKIVRLRDEQGSPIGLIETWQDLTERKNLEKQLLHSQRLEAMGRLAGAIAHDFTNFLQAILVLTDAAKFGIARDDPIQRHLDGIQQTVFRAKELIDQIKVFSRRNLLEPKPIRLKTVVETAVASIKPQIPPTIDLRLSIDSEVCIMADEFSIARVVTNLCVNAVNALGNTGGTLALRLATVDLTRDAIRVYPDLQPGPHAKLTVSDTGKGIPAEHLERIFEPFFTTRKSDGGTGMGLAITHGIVKGYGGAITVESQEGKGTAFDILWPAIEPMDATADSSGDLPQRSKAM